MKTKLFLMLLIGILSVSCVPKEGPNCHLFVTIVNQTEEDIYANFKSEDTRPSLYPILEPYRNPGRHLVGARGGINMNAIRFGRPACLETKLYHTNMLIYVFDRQLYDATPEDELKNLPYESYIFTLEDFRNLDWKITYPKDMIGREYEK